jgi:hypothetical protein
VIDSGEPSVNHDEDLLDDIIHRGRTDAETANQTPNQVEVLPVYGFERRHFAGNGG